MRTIKSAHTKIENFINSNFGECAEQYRKHLIEIIFLTDVNNHICKKGISLNQLLNEVLENKAEFLNETAK